ncbi:3-phosphoshikimate 1-carboxyvinyltransferase [bacterium]|nr:3-phosphoshikimate 1-carboxyvinyltransferase [bacterium]
MSLTLPIGKRKGTVTPPFSKSHLHRLLIADFLGGNFQRLAPSPTDSEDIAATKRCLLALGEDTNTPVLDCGESGSTLRFLKPVAAALKKHPRYVTKGRLAECPGIDYPELECGLHELPGNVSSQFATGLLFALPILKGDSEIRFNTPLESRGYVDMTLQVLRQSGVTITETPRGFLVPGNQTYTAPVNVEPERDWSGASFFIAMNYLGSEIKINGLNDGSLQPDRALPELLKKQGEVIDVSQCPDIFPPLAVAFAGKPGTTTITGIRRLRLKESDRVKSTSDLLTNLNVKHEIAEDAFTIQGQSQPFSPNPTTILTYGDHRLAMSAAVAATNSQNPIAIDDASCCAKSYPSFFAQFSSLALI